MVARERQFVDVAENFPNECRYVLELLGQVYLHDKSSSVNCDFYQVCRNEAWNVAAVKKSKVRRLQDLRDRPERSERFDVTKGESLSE
jgi:hypothetical protein